MFKVLIWVVGECGGARPSGVLSFCGNSLFVHEVSFLLHFRSRAMTSESSVFPCVSSFAHVVT